MKIDRLKVAGFKSFADPVAISIEPGVTGVVGPNGCGKSNLIEALRWAMGETSAKRMRAEGGMDDIIFGGTETRPPRASCEVTISIDNTEKKAPPEFNDSDRLEISRRIERGEGSTYSVNGRTARARDVQVLYKDAGIGAGSSALISQGKVGQIIAAKPSERRAVLEEAAGVTGLTSRKRDAELKLGGAEANLDRAEDMEKGLSEQVTSLRRQARQAKRHAEIDALVRAAEAAILLVRWKSAEAKLAASQIGHADNEEAFKQDFLAYEGARKSLVAAEEEAAPALKARQEAETAFALAGAAVELTRKEIQAVQQALAAARKAADRATSDIERETAALGSAGEEYEELKDRRAIALDDSQYDAVLISEAEAVSEERKSRVDDATTESRRLGEKLAEAKSSHAAALGHLEQATRRRAAAQQSLETSLARVRSASEALRSLGEPDDAEKEAETLLAELEDGYGAAADLAAVAQEEAAAARAAAAEMESRVAVLKREMAGLARPVGTECTADTLIQCPSGLEPAVAAALGEALSAPVGGEAGRRWSGSQVFSVAPGGTEPLVDLVTAPAELTAALSAIGVADGDAFENAELSPGQTVVNHEGSVKRWDGYRSDARSASAENLRRGRRLAELETELPHNEKLAAQAMSAAETKIRAATDTKQEAESYRFKVAEARASLARLRSQRQEAERERSRLTGELAAAEAAAAAGQTSLSSEVADEAAAQASLSGLPETAELDACAEEARRTELAAVKSYEDARTILEKARADAQGRVVELQSIERQMQDFDRRVASARERVEELRGRVVEYQAEVARLEAIVAEGPAREESVACSLEEASATLEESRTRAEETEAALMAARSSVAGLDETLALRRESRARLLAELKAAQEASGEVAREVKERLSCTPGDLHAQAGVADGQELPPLDACEARFQRLSRERDGIGIVNLLAQAQLEEAEKKLGENAQMRHDLRDAIRRLRATISEIDAERRVRLTEAFALVDGHFRDLFTRLFGGGHAYLKLSGSDDILEAGLEIYACPPGKKLQAMSLLSGGEQALSAIALVFAAFLVRPAPVCVLDEVDAPLDDSNVDRFCSLVADMSREGVRFLVVTHHALTMARCDRLFGVTMSERGVSRVASLDMAQAANLVITNN